MAIDQELNYGFGIMKDLYLIAMTYKNLNEYDKALSYLKRSEELCNTTWSQDFQEIQELYYLIYKEKRQYKLALNYYESYLKIKDSIASRDVKEKISQLHMEYETEKKEQEIQHLNAENQLKDQKLQIRSIFMISLIIIFVMALLLTLLLLRQKNMRIQNMNIDLRNFLLEVEELKTALSNKHEWHENQINELFDKYEITGREADVLHLISLGHSNFEIADKLFISINTVKYHIKNIYLKLDAKNRVEIINKFAANNLVVS